MIHPQRRNTVSIGNPDDEGFSDSVVIDEKRANIATYFSLTNQKAKYEYDFGDGWEHEVLLEEIVAGCSSNKYPQCIAGKRACPPEDCGGVYGYGELLEIMSNPDHEEYSERSEWLRKIGHGELNPEEFDPRLANLFFSWLIFLLNVFFLNVGLFPFLINNICKCIVSLQ